MDHPKKTKLTCLKVHRSKQEVSAQRQQPQNHATASVSKNTVQKSDLSIMITSKEQILSNDPDIFEGIGRFPSLPYHIQVKTQTSHQNKPQKVRSDGLVV